MKFQIVVQIPALDRLLDQIESADKTQAKVDDLTRRITKFNARITSALKVAD